MTNSYKYDAFISYRHLETDSLIAKKLQKLLEGYKTPKGVKCEYTSQIKRVFVDDTELTSNGDLNNEIKGALEQSRFLIVICSEKTKESKWCMQEIEYFKSLHNGHLDNILTLLVSGEPNDVFPQQLCYETKEVIDEYGNAQTIEYEVEPLAANVSGKNQRQAIKRLKKEYMRLAAAIVGCEFDSLYQRHRRRKIKHIVSLVAILLLLIFMVGAVLHNQFVRSEENKALRLHGSAVSLMRDTVNTANYQKALYYLTESAMCSYPKNKYQNEAIHTALRTAVFPIQSEKLSGKILGNAIITKTASQNGYREALVSESMKFVEACNPENGSMLIHSGSDGYFTDKGKKISDERFLISCDNGRYWVFAQDEKTVQGQKHSVTVYDSEIEGFYTLDFVAENNPLFEIEENDDCYMSVDVCESYAAITCRGYFYLYTFTENTYKPVGTFSYAEFLSSKSEISGKYPLATKSNILLSQKLKMAVIVELAEMIVISLESNRLITVIPNNGELVSDFSFSESGFELLISYGSAHNMSKGRIELYRYDTGLQKYECIYTRSTEKALAQACFAEGGEAILARDFTSGIYITAKNPQNIYQDYSPVYMTNKIKAVIGGKDFAFAVSTNDDNVYFIDIVSQREKRFHVNPGERGYQISEIHPVSHGKLAVLSRKYLKIMDTDGDVTQTHYFDSKEYFDFLEANRQKFQDNFTFYDTQWGKWSKFEFPGSKELEKSVTSQLIRYCSDKKIPVNQDMTSVSDSICLSQDGNNIYVTKSIQPCLCSFKIKDAKTAELEHGIIYSSEIPKDLFDPLNGKQIALTTSSGKVLVYSLPLSDKEPKSVTASTSGEIREVRIDKTGRFMALSIKTGNYDVLELWDLENLNLLDVKNDGKTSVSGMCFYDNKLYYGFGEYVCCINISGNKYSYHDYNALAQLCGVIEKGKDNLAYSIPDKNSIKDMLDVWGLDIYTELNRNQSDENPIEDKLTELSDKVKGKSTEEKLKVLQENKKAFCELYTGLNGLTALSEFYYALVDFTKSVEGVEAAKALAQEYCNIVSADVCKPIYEWDTTERSVAKLNLYYYVLNVYSVIQEEPAIFEDFFKKVSDYNMKVVENAMNIHDYFDILMLTKSTLATLANEGTYLSYVISGDIDALEKEISDYGLININDNDDAVAKAEKKQWMLRLSVLRGDVENAVKMEYDIFEAFPEDYEMIMYNDWRYFKMFEKLGIISEAVLDGYYSAFAGINGTRDHYLGNG